MKTLLVRFLILIILCVSGSLSLAAAEASRVDAFLSTVKTQKKLLQEAPGKETKQKPAVLVHFMWASWCEYCDQAYTALYGMTLDKKFAGKVQVVGYDLDEEITPAVKTKLKDMPALEENFVSSKSLKIPDELRRFPILIVENSQTHELKVYTGFTNERFDYLKKQVRRILYNAEGDNEE